MGACASESSGKYACVKQTRLVIAGDNVNAVSAERHAVCSCYLVSGVKGAANDRAPASVRKCSLTESSTHRNVHRSAPLMASHSCTGWAREVAAKTQLGGSVARAPGNQAVS